MICSIPFCQVTSRGNLESSSFFPSSYPMRFLCMQEKIWNLFFINTKQLLMLRNILIMFLQTSYHLRMEKTFQIQSSENVLYTNLHVEPELIGTDHLKTISLVILLFKNQFFKCENK